MDIRVECVTPDGLSGKKRVWFRGIFHLVGILGESPFVSNLRMAESAQHGVLMNSSVHFGKNEGPPSCVGARGPRNEHIEGHFSTYRLSHN